MKTGQIGVMLAVIVMSTSACQRGLIHRDGDGGKIDGLEANSAAQGGEFQGPKKKVMVLNLWNDTPVLQEGLGTFAAEELRRGLILTGKVLLTPEIRTELNTQDFLQGEKVKVAPLIREGRRLGVSVLVIGRITKVSFRQSGDEIGLLKQKQSRSSAVVEIKAFDILGGREVVAITRSGETSDRSMTVFEGTEVDTPEYRAELNRAAVQEAVAALIPELIQTVQKMTWQGRIAKLVGPKVYVNAGRESGLMAGDILKVVNPGEDIYDPQSGNYLGRSLGQLKGTVEVVDFLGNDAARTHIHTGGNFQEGDLVQLY